MAFGRDRVGGRPLPPRAQAGQRRHGHRLARRGPATGPAGRGQGPVRGDPRRSRPSRSASSAKPGQRPRSPILTSSRSTTTATRTSAPTSSASTSTAGASPSCATVAAARHRGARGDAARSARAHPCRGNRPPRHQAGQRPRRPRRTDPADRLRDRPIGRRDRADQRRPRRRDASYLAPELKRGGRATPASDLYSLGVLLSEQYSPEDPDRIGRLIDALTAAAPADRPADAEAALEILQRRSVLVTAVNPVEDGPERDGADRQPSARVQPGAGARTWRRIARGHS